MKKLLMVLAAFAMVAMSAWAIEEDVEAINPNKLPKFSMSIIQSYFPGAQVMTAFKEKSKIRNAYAVELDNGVKCEFDKDGQWIMVEAGDQLVPARMVPGKVVMYLQNGNLGSSVNKMLKDPKGNYTITLKDGTELHFDNQFRPIE